MGAITSTRKQPREPGGTRPKPTKKAQKSSAGEAPTASEKRHEKLVEDDVSNVIGKSKPVCEAKLVDTRRPRSEPSPSFPARLAVTSQSAASKPLQGSRSPARASPLDPTSTALQLESENKPSRLVRAIQRLTRLPACKVHKPSIHFQASAEAALHNWEMLRKKGNSLPRLLLEQPFSVMTPGSEFRSVKQLEKLLASHPLWERWEVGLSHGVTYPLEPYSENEMKLDLAAQLERGNHQSAKACLGVLDKLNAEDVEHGYSFCLPVEALHDIEKSAVAPHGVVHQGTINELGQLITKDRPTHDQSFAARPGGKSINDRCVMELLTPCMFGHALLRIIHFILHLRTRFPQKRIFLQKVDFKSAYRRMHLSAGMAAKCVTVVRKLAYVSLRLPFGGRPCPSLWSDFSETITDLSNAIANDESWDPDTLHSPLQHLIPKTVTEPDGIPFEQARPMSVTVPDSDGVYKSDVFIDDVISVVLDDDEGCKRGAAASLLAIHAVCRPVSVCEPVPRNELTAEKKLIAESLLEEVKTTLGWLLDTRRLLISLNMEKYSAWAAAIIFILITESCGYEDLETLVGRLNHVCFIIPAA